MKKIVVINTKTGEVQSVEKYVKNSSDIWIAGWIQTDLPEAIPSPKQVSGTVQDIFKNLNHRLELQEYSTYEFSNQVAGLSETSQATNRKVEQVITGFDNKIVNIADLLENLNKRMGEIEGSKVYTLKESDTIIKELARQKAELTKLTEPEKKRGRPRK